MFIVGGGDSIREGASNEDITVIVIWCFFIVILNKLLKNSRLSGDLRRLDVHGTSF